MDIAELRADILQLREMYEPGRLAAELKSQEIEDVAGATKQKQQLARRSSEMTGLLRLTASIGVIKKRAKHITFTSGLYPCYVISFTQLDNDMDKLMIHEDALKTNRLDILSPSTTVPSR